MSQTKLDINNIMGKPSLFPMLFFPKMFLKLNIIKYCVLDCAAKLQSGANVSGIYSDIDPDVQGPMNVSCDMITDGGGWTVIQRRVNGSVDFALDWASYKQGFGTLSDEFWLGNDNIHRLTAAGNTVLRVELEDWNNNSRYAEYGVFKVDDESNKYRLTVGSYSGTAGDSFTGYSGRFNHNGMYFSTKDSDNDIQGINCAVSFPGGWWFGGCLACNLNGLYLGNVRNQQGIHWAKWDTSLSFKRAEMKIRPSVR